MGEGWGHFAHVCSAKSAFHSAKSTNALSEIIHSENNQNVEKQTF